MSELERLLATRGIPAQGEAWVHGMWTPRVWLQCLGGILRGRRLVRMTHGSLSPVYLKLSSPWKKRLVSPIERLLFALSSEVAVTGPWEERWCRAWGLCGPFRTIDPKTFFKFPTTPLPPLTGARTRMLYLGRRHPLKGVEELEEAVAGLGGIELEVATNVFGDERERVFERSDVLVLPTRSENFGLVVAEALERGLRVIVTDGAPAWDPAPDENARYEFGLGGRLLYVRGYADAPRPGRIEMLRTALSTMVQSSQTKEISS